MLVNRTFLNHSILNEFVELLLLFYHYGRWSAAYPAERTGEITYLKAITILNV